MGKAAVATDLAEGWRFTVFGELYSKRPRQGWAPDTGASDGLAYGLVHASLRASELGLKRRLGIDVSVRNVLNTAAGTGVYRDDVNTLAGDQPRYPGDFTVEGRAVTVGLDFAL